MLSRVADSLYWMGRSLERAECIARIVDVNQQLMLDLPVKLAARVEKDWSAVVTCLGDEKFFRKRYRRSDARSVTEFLVFERDNQNSVVGCLAAARENARTIRERISPEMWEQINRTYLWCISKGARQFYDRNAYEFFQRVIKALQLFQGITDGSMVHDDGWEFIQLGKLLERADKTTRALDDEFHLLPTENGAPTGNLLQWLAVLDTCNARQAYQRIYASEIRPIQVSELLLLNESFPRSVEFCVGQVDLSLRRISGVASGRFSNAAEKRSGRLFSELCYSTIEEMFEKGLHQAVDEIQVRLNGVGEAIFDTYIQPTILEPVVVREASEHPQDQQ